jgi:hypothetical protein
MGIHLIPIPQEGDREFPPWRYFSPVRWRYRVKIVSLALVLRALTRPVADPLGFPGA